MNVMKRCGLGLAFGLAGLGGCRTVDVPPARVTWVAVDLHSADHPAARRLKDLNQSVGEDKKFHGRELMLGELDVLLDQLVRDDAGKVLAYVSLGLGGEPSEVRSFAWQPAPAGSSDLPKGIVLQAEARPVPGKPSQFVIVLNDMGGNAYAWSGGNSGRLIDTRSDIGKVIGAGWATGSGYEEIKLLVVEPARRPPSRLDYSDRDVLPGRDD